MFLNKSPLFVASIIALVIASIATVGLATMLNMTQTAYSDLLSGFNEVSGKYDNLQSNYDRLVRERERYRSLDLPLESKRIPSTNELKIWLQIDKTDEYRYNDPDFACFHFSLLLMLHGRAEHYDIGVVAIYGRNDKTGKPFSHFVNAVITTEGLVYIEPQLDEVWWLDDHSEITNSTTQAFLISEDPIYVVRTSIFFDY